MADHVFSAARLRGYRVIEAAGLGDAIALHILDTAIAAQLWLPLSLAEVGFRNAADRALARSDGEGQDWLLAAGREADGLRAAAVVGTDRFREGDDPIADAATRASAHLGRELILRDDLIAHLMLGFWVVRVPEGLRGSGTDVFALAAERLVGRFHDPAELRDAMVGDVLDARNRVAHHEPIVLRAKHVFQRRSGEAKQPIELADSMLGAIAKFRRRRERIFGVARAFAPMAATYLDDAEETITTALDPVAEKLTTELERLRHESRVRRAERRS